MHPPSTINILWSSWWLLALLFMIANSVLPYEAARERADVGEFHISK
jgi:hypothetical protein